MGKCVDLIGQKFNRLTVIKRLENKGSRAQWLCQCDCGGTIISDSYRLTHGVTKSCGCYKAEKTSERSLEDLTGKEFGRLTVMHRANNRGKATMWHCKCQCGNEVDIAAASLKNGTSQSCGCLQKEIVSGNNKTHGMSNSKFYHIWSGMKARCYNQNAGQYKDYGGRGIKMCDEWRNNFMAFYRWAITHGYSDGLSIDRIDVNKDYSPENCRWATDYVQSNNRRNNIVLEYNGESHTMSQWAEKLGIAKQTLKDRIRRYGWSVERALTEPVRHW